MFMCQHVLTLYAPSICCHLGSEPVAVLGSSARVFVRISGHTSVDGLVVCSNVVLGAHVVEPTDFAHSLKQSWVIR